MYRPFTKFFFNLYLLRAGVRLQFTRLSVYESSAHINVRVSSPRWIPFSVADFIIPWAFLTILPSPWPCGLPCVISNSHGTLNMHNLFIGPLLLLGSNLLIQEIWRMWAIIKNWKFLYNKWRSLCGIQTWQFLRIFYLLQAAEENNCAIFVHPWDMDQGGRMKKYWLPWLVGA